MTNFATKWYGGLLVAKLAKINAMIVKNLRVKLDQPKFALNALNGICYKTGYQLS